MKKFLFALCFIMAVFAGCTTSSTEYPQVIKVYGERHHAQGIAFDESSGLLYSSFTSSFLKSGVEGELIGSITGINGHLGAMTFDPASRKVYASLEMKDDAIGRNISTALGVNAYTREQSRFYIAEIDVDKVNGPDTPFEEAVILHKIEDAGKDYAAEVEVNGVKLEHRYGCSGIDGVAVAPAFGNKKNRTNERYLYVGYGVYGDTTRTDNDYNILLCYSLNDLKTPLHKYFIRTGNTTFGIQNMTYDSFSDRLYLAVYKGKKAEYHNYSTFAVEMSQEPFYDKLKGAPYQTEEVEQVSFCKGWHFKWGSMGLCSLGNGYFYISENGKEDGREFCNATLYKLTADGDLPFISMNQTRQLDD